MIDAEGLGLAPGGRELLTDAAFVLERGEHVSLVGPNGSGKTTLLETILGRRAPDAGQVKLGYGVEAAYFSQHEAELDERGSVLEAAMGATGLRRPQAQALLGRFLFSGWAEHEKQVTALSGGERRRLTLAIVVASGANLLILDEPTNHLDVESREALEAALEAYPGTVLLVTHDRALLDAVSGRLLAIEERRLVSYPGGWAEYRRDEPAAGSAPRARQALPSRAAPPAPGPPAARDPLEQLEGEITRTEGRVAELERKLAEDWANVDLVARPRARHARELGALLARWERLVVDRARPQA